MRKFKTDERLNKIVQTASMRQFSLRIILENIHDPHNVSAIFRSCDAVGVQNISLLYNFEKFPKVSRVSSASANKWIEVEKYSSAQECVQKLKQDGFIVAASLLDKNALNLYEIDFTKKIAVVMGNEHRGVSPEMAELADIKFYIPMRGMIQSLNVSVAAAVTLYEAQRQRSQMGMYESSELSKKALDSLIDKWCDK